MPAQHNLTLDTRTPRRLAVSLSVNLETVFDQIDNNGRIAALAGKAQWDDDDPTQQAMT